MATIIKDINGINIDIGAKDFPPCWDWPLHYGCSKKDQDEMWKRINENPTFWETLPGMPNAAKTIQRIKTLSHHNDIYFITHRHAGPTTKQQTERWFRDMGYPGATVILSDGSKGWIAGGIGLDAFIDDKPRNLWHIRQMMGLDCKLYLMNHPHNKDAEERSFAIAVDSVEEMLDKEFPMLKEDEWR
jgi:5'(3')-deoxyribonucleotidase